MEIQGTIIQVLPLETGVSKSGNSWQKKNFVIETGGQYPKKVCINLFGDNVVKFPLQVGQSVTAHIDIESREFNVRWYTDVRAWNVTYNDTSGLAPTAQTAPAPAPQQSIQQPQPTTANDLPF